jgi:hypothetical protein
VVSEVFFGESTVEEEGEDSILFSDETTGSAILRGEKEKKKQTVSQVGENQNVGGRTNGKGKGKKKCQTVRGTVVLFVLFVLFILLRFAGPKRVWHAVLKRAHNRTEEDRRTKKKKEGWKEKSEGEKGLERSPLTDGPINFLNFLLIFFHSPALVDAH